MSCSPETKLLVITAGDDEQAVVRWLKHGASGCVGTCQSCPQIVRAIHAVHAGEVWAPRKTVTRALRELLPLKRQGDRNTAARAHLSQRECEIVDWMCRGMSNKEIARILGISDMTVKTHAHNIFHKLDISGRVRLVGSMSPHEN